MTTTLNEVTILSYQPKYAEDYKQLNLAWIEKYFKVEEHDIEQLDNPDAYIISKGGYILFAKYDGAIVGTCALIKTGDSEYELAKMAVTDAFKGKGISKLLIEKCLSTAATLGAKKIYLQSNSQLITALALYEKYGFKHVPVVNAHYTTADVMMEKIL